MTLDSYLVGSIFIIVSALFSMVGLLIFRRSIDIKRLEAAHDISGNFLSIVGTMYAVLLGLIVVDAMGAMRKPR